MLAMQRPSGETAASAEVTTDDMGHNCFAIEPRRVVPHTVLSACQHLGHRKTQEDRFVVGNFDSPGERLAFFGVFDGTVGDFASRNAGELAVPCLVNTRGWAELQVAKDYRERVVAARETMEQMYHAVDDTILKRMAEQHDHYATSTSVTALVLDDLLVVGHIGDSRIVVGWEEPGGLMAECLTEDHKPDLDVERARIEANGGSVECLVNHGNKAYIRGGDFLLRKALGEKPMQLQYARAFGAKDLKMFGVSSIPDVKTLNLKDRRIRYLILASDGIWDMMTPLEAVTVAHVAHQKGLSSAEHIIRLALSATNEKRGKSDNITAVVVRFDL